MKGFAYEHADALAMAVRLRMANRCPADISDLLGRVVMDLVYMAARLMAYKPKYSSEGRIKIIFDMDNRMDAVMRIMKAIDERKIRTDNPKAMVNYMVFTAQNSFRNAIYFAENRQRIGKMVNVDEVTDRTFKKFDRITAGTRINSDSVLSALSGCVSNLYGETEHGIPGKKVLAILNQ